MRPHPCRRWTIAAASVYFSALAVAQTTRGLAGEIPSDAQAFIRRLGQGRVRSLFGS